MKFILGFIFFVTQVGLGSVLEAFGSRHSVLAVEFCGQQPLGGALGNCNSTLKSPVAFVHSSSSHEDSELVHDTQENYQLSTINYQPRPFVALHDYHISNFEIEYNAETKALEIIAKIFIDDLEDGIAASGVEEKLYLCTDREIDSSDDYVYSYLSSKMNIAVNGKEVPLSFIGKEASEDLVAMYCYLEVIDVNDVNEITISNDMLMDLFDDQINIVKLKSKSTGKRGFMMLKKGQHSDTVQLQ